MADNIARVNGKDAFAGVGKAWHQKGVVLDAAVDAATMIEASGLDFPVELVPVTVDWQGAPMEVPNRYAIRRGDNGAIFEVVSGIYEPVQNRDAFKFFDEVVGDGQAVYHTAGALGKGERVWILAKLPRTIAIAGDEVEEYVLLWNGHGDGSAFNFQTTPIKVVCQNTLNFAIRGVNMNRLYRRQHLRGINNRLNADDAREILGLAETYYEHFEQVARELAATKMTAKALDDFVTLLLPAPKPVLLLPAPNPDNYVKVPALTIKRREAVKEKILTGTGLTDKGVKGTAWAALNGVVEYVDYDRGRDVDRDASALIGTGRELKQRAFDILTGEIKA